MGHSSRQKISRLKVIHIVPSIKEEASGPSYTVPKLCDSLRKNDKEIAELRLISLGKTRESSYEHKLFPWSPFLYRLGFSPAMKRWLQYQVNSSRVDIIHNHSLWMMPNVYAGQIINRSSKTKLIVSPRGALSRYALGINSYQKKVFGTLLQYPVLKKASCFHATATSECEEIRALGYGQPVAIIPNGIDVPVNFCAKEGSRKKLLFLGRIHRKKGFDILLPAWREIQSHFPEWDLDIVGPDDGGYEKTVKHMSHGLGCKRVYFRGPVYSKEKWYYYMKSHLFILPTHSENFGMSVAEALICKTPAIVTKGAPWKGLDLNKAGMWIDISTAALVQALRAMMSKKQVERDEMGQWGHLWMRKDFSWSSVGNKMADTYKWLHFGGECPDWISLD
jgi:glycosyltransferase involved in cell wall biosynthesis